MASYGTLMAVDISFFYHLPGWRTANGDWRPLQLAVATIAADSSGSQESIVAIRTHVG